MFLRTTPQRKSRQSDAGAWTARLILGPRREHRIGHRWLACAASGNSRGFEALCHSRSPRQVSTMPGTGRIQHPALARKVVPADVAAAMIGPGATVGMSGFTGAGYPKEVPLALARRITEANANGARFRINVWTGASTAPELDGALAAADGIELRLPYQSDPVSREKINSGHMEYIDVHLSHVAQMVWEGFLGHLDVALIEVSGITADGDLIPSSSVGNNKTWIDQADAVILEVNSWQSADLEGMHDIYYGTALPPNRRPIQLVRPGDRIGEPYLRCPPEKVVAVVETDAPDRNTAFSPPDEASRRIAGHLIEFLEHEVGRGRLPAELLPIQSGVGNVANAVLAELGQSRFENLTAYTEVIQDGMLGLLTSGTLSVASATAFSLSPDAVTEFNDNARDYRDRIVLRPQEISNHPELVRRLGVLAMNGVIEADIYGNVNSTHLMGSRIQNGIGGSGDFARNAYISFFVTPSTAKGGAISSIVPMVSHVDHTEHDVNVIVTEQGLADLRGLAPRRRARLLIDTCAHPDFRPLLEDYADRALSGAFGRHTPHLLEEALSWHARYVRTGSMTAQ
jgi:succinyl-CoA:acetate CoA-transferase